MTKNLTEGSPMKLIVGFAVPLMFGLLLQQIYSLVDTIIVGQTLGTEALAAVGATGSINFLVLGFCTGACAGFTIPIAQRFGAGDLKAMRKFIGNGTWMSVFFAAVITTITVAFCRPILEAMNTPGNIIDGAYSYIVVIFAGIPAIYLYNYLSGIIRSVGDSKTPLVFVLVASGINIGLDLLFILVFRMGVAGAGWATVISQAISGILCLLWIVKKYEILKMSRDEWRLEKSYVNNLLYMGVPMGLQYSITAIGSVILQTSVNGIGSDAVASITAGTKISMFMVCPVDAIGTTMTTYGGQNVGAKKLDRIGVGVRDANILGAIYSVIAFLILYFASRPLLLLFLKPTETVIIAQARQFLLVNSACYFLLVLLEVFRFLIQGMGYSLFAVFAGVAEMIARIVMGIFIVPRFGFDGACFASPLAWVFACAFLIPAYYYVLKRLRKVLKV